MFEQVSLTINLCKVKKQTAGNFASPILILSTFLLFFYLNHAAALAPKTKEELLVRIKDAYAHKRLFINTEGTCASNAYLFLGAQTPEQHIMKKKSLGTRSAVVGNNNKVFTQWLIYRYRDIPAIAEFADTYKKASDYEAHASTLSMYFVQHLETMLDNISPNGQPFFTYMGFSSKQEPMSSHAVVIWYNPKDKHIFIINPQDFMADGRIVYGAGNNWRDYFGAEIRHYNLYKYVEDNMDFFAGLGKVSLLTEFHKDNVGGGRKTRVKRGGTKPTITLPNGHTHKASLLDTGEKQATFQLSDGSLFFVTETNDGKQNMQIQLKNGKRFYAIMLETGVIAPIDIIDNKVIPFIVDENDALIPATILLDNTLFAAIKVGDNYILPTKISHDELLYDVVTRFHTNHTLSVVLPIHFQITFINKKNGYDQYEKTMASYNIFSMVHPTTGIQCYFAVNSKIHYIFINATTTHTYFSWLTPTDFKTNKKAIDLALKLTINIKSHPQIETVACAQHSQHFELANAAPHIEQLNQMLSLVGDATLELGYLQNMGATDFYAFNNIDEILYNNELLLCLNVENKCVSSITLKCVDNIVSLDTYTKHECQGKLFNKLLRAASIILLPHIYPEATMLRSVAVNYLSAYQMIKYFGGIVTSDVAHINFDFSAFLEGKPLRLATLTDVTRYFKNNENVDVVVDTMLNAENVEKATIVFESVITDFDRFSC